MKTYKGKVIPIILYTFEKAASMKFSIQDQIEDSCFYAQCVGTDIKCKDCLFSNVNLFDEWIKNEFRNKKLERILK